MFWDLGKSLLGISLLTYKMGVISTVPDRDSVSQPRERVRSGFGNGEGLCHCQSLVPSLLSGQERMHGRIGIAFLVR